MSAQQKPQRTCIGCRITTDQNLLMRWVAEADDGGHAVVADRYRRMSGRGAWLHPTPECAAQAVKRRAFARAFKAHVDASYVVAEVQALGAVPPRGHAATTVQRESGSEI